MPRRGEQEPPVSSSETRRRKLVEDLGEEGYSDLQAASHRGDAEAFGQILDGESPAAEGQLGEESRVDPLP